MRKLFLASALLVPMTMTSQAHNPQNFPGMFLFGGYMTQETAAQCQQILADACNREFGNCKKSTIGQTLAVDFAEAQFNFSMQCTNFSRIGATIYSVSGSAAYGHGKGLRDIVVRIKNYIDNTAQ